MFRTMTIALALAALVACAACNSVTAPTTTTETVQKIRPAAQQGHDRGELSDPGDGGGGIGEGPMPGDAIRPGRRGGHNQYDDGNSSDPGRRVPNGTGSRRGELSDPGDGQGGGSGEGAIPDNGQIRPGPRGGHNQYDDGNGSDPGRRMPNGTGGR